MDFFGCEVEGETLCLGVERWGVLFMYFCYIWSVWYHFPFTDTALKIKSLYIQKVSFAATDEAWFYKACLVASAQNITEVPWGRAPSSQD